MRGTEIPFGNICYPFHVNLVLVNFPVASVYTVVNYLKYFKPYLESETSVFILISVSHAMNTLFGHRNYNFTRGIVWDHFLFNIEFESLVYLDVLYDIEIVLDHLEIKATKTEGMKSPWGHYYNLPLNLDLVKGAFS